VVSEQPPSVNHQFHHVPKSESSSSELPECERFPDTLIGRILPDTALEIDWPTIEDTVAEGLLPGGCWEPTTCRSPTKTAVIVPYKDREVHLKRLLYYLHPFLRRQQIAYCIVVAEQFHDGRFNKGILMNAAFTELMKIDNFNCVIFHDVDMLPEDDRNRYACGANPVHLSLMINKYKYRYPYGTDFGGVTMMSALNYTNVNGHTNVFWGWGREDSDIEYRIRKQLKIKKPEVFDSARYSMCGHSHPWTFQNEKHKAGIENSYQAVTHKMLMKLKDYRNKYDGLNSLQYEVKNVTKAPLFTHLMLETRLLVPKTILVTHQADTKIDITYPESGLISDENCEMKEFKGASIRSNILDKYLRDTAKSVDRCLEIGVYCQAIAPESSMTVPSDAEFRLRELPLLRSHNVSDAWIKDCSGNLAYYQVAQTPFLYPKLTNTEANESQIEIDFVVTAKVNFGPDDQVWYRDSQLFESYQVNEFTTEVTKKELHDNSITTNFIEWTGESEIKMKITIIVPKKIPGFYTILSKMVDVLGQPILEFNWNFRLTTGNRKRDNLLRASIKHDEFERMGGGKIAIIWGRTIQNAAKRKGIQNVDITFDQEAQSPSEKRHERRGQGEKL
jgi:hypothetical protein